MIVRFMLKASICWLFLFGCNSDSLKIRLHELARSDLQGILQQLNEKQIKVSVLEKPYYVIADFREFDKSHSSRFDGYAEVRYFYLKSPRFFQIRKYRFRNAGHVWDRYDLELKHVYHEPNKEQRNYLN